MRNLNIAIFCLVFIITACASNETVEPNESSGEETEMQAQETEDKELEVEEQKDIEDEEKVTEDKREPQYYIAEDSTVIPLNDSFNENVVLLTIDDAPSTYSLEMAETLKKLEVDAIFFVNGHFLDTPEEEEALKQLHKMGFLIGNHTYNHPLLTEISEEEQRDEIVSLSDRVEEIIGERPKFFRAPNGMNTDFTEELVAEEGMVLMNWTYGYDYFQPYMDADKLAEAMISGEGPEVDVPYSLLRPGANLLMHDREWTSEALERIVNGLQEQGYEIVDPKLIQTIDEVN